MEKKKPRKIPQFKVLFDLKGNLCSDNGSWITTRPDFSLHYKTEDNIPFVDTFEYTGYQSASGGNSHILFKSVKTGRQVNMFMSDFDEVINANRFIDKQIVGLFCFCKKSSKQGVRLILDDAP